MDEYELKFNDETLRVSIARGIASFGPETNKRADVVIETEPDGQRAWAFFSYSSLLAGDANDGVWGATITLPHYSEQGTWTLALVNVGDRVGNQKTTDGAAFAGRPGFDTTFDVLRTDPWP